MRSLFLFLLAASSVWCQPSQVILIRHAENPSQGNYLSLKGRQRAAALVPSFLSFPSLLQFGQPTAIFAMKPSPSDPSLRSEQTVMVLAEELAMPLQTDFAAGQTAELANTVLNTEEYEGKMVLICWPHAEIPKLAALLGAKEAPKKWAEDTYDRFWILTYEDNGKISFQNLPQRLLYGDSNR